MIKNFQKQNKKGQIGATITWIVAFLIIFFIMLLFVSATAFLTGKKFLFGEGGNEIDFGKGSARTLESLDYQRELMKILNSPTEVEGGISVRVLIGLWYSDKDKYKDVLNNELTKVLTGFEYEFVHPKTKNLRMKGFELLVYSKKHVKGEMPDVINRISSERYDGGYCVSDTGGCVDLAGVYIPVSEMSTVYVALRVSQEAKEK